MSVNGDHFILSSQLIFNIFFSQLLTLSVFDVNVLFGLDTLRGKQSQNLKVVQIEIGLVITRKISYISNTFGIDQMKNFSNTKRIKTN